MIKLIYPKFWQTKNIYSYLLWPLSLVYKFLGWLRKLFSQKIILPAKVICVGNITVGGTGKTQMVIWLAKLFSAANLNFVILAKGYRGNFKQALIVGAEHESREIGDEAILLSHYGTTIVAKKIAQAMPLLAKLKPQVIIVDDGMQNPGFHKDLTITMIDNNRGFGNKFLLPAGPLRQPWRAGLAQADIIITVSNNYQPSAKIVADLADKPVFKAKLAATSKLDKSKKYLAFTGIGNPERFFVSLKNYGLILEETMIFPDHHHYSGQDLALLEQKAAASGAILITTAKDYVKITPQKLAVIKFDVELDIANVNELIEIIYEKLS